MDEDLLFGVFFLIVVILIPISVVSLILTITAAVETRRWQKKKALRLQNSDISDTLLNKESVDSDSDLEILDSEDEAEKQDRADAKCEEEADWLLTTKQKFWKEFSQSFKGRGAKTAERAQKKKEREERRKLAKDVVKVMRRFERRQAKLDRRAIRDGSSTGMSKEDSLPSYRTALDAKQ